MFNAFKKPDPKEQQRQIDRNLRKATRDIERDRRQLEIEEKKLEQEIKKLAKAGNTEGCKVLARQLIQIRKQKNRTYTASSKIQSVGAHGKAMGANVKIADAMAVAGQSMGQVNRTMNPEKLSGIMNEFSKQNTKMEMTDEIINDAFDDMLHDSDEEAESDNVVSKVLDEIGIEISGKMIGAPTPEDGSILGESSKSNKLTDSQIEDQLAKLKAQ